MLKPDYQFYKNTDAPNGTLGSTAPCPPNQIPPLGDIIAAAKRARLRYALELAKKVKNCRNIAPTTHGVIDNKTYNTGSNTPT